MFVIFFLVVSLSLSKAGAKKRDFNEKYGCGYTFNFLLTLKNKVYHSGFDKLSLTVLNF